MNGPHFTSGRWRVSQTRRKIEALICESALCPKDAEPEALDLGGAVTLIADPTMLRVYEILQNLARSMLPVTITGDTGTGKEHAARAVHYFSVRRDAPFVAINCAAIPDSLLESELFGYLRGAFSGATNDKIGRFEVAHGGTIFLDEVGELSKMAQAKLLRVLEDGLICPVGGVRERKVDCRVVAATNQDLEADVRAGRFRQDLYFRLAAAVVPLPRLTERPMDIPILASHFLRQACRASSRAVPTITDSTLAILTKYSFPGNVRELRNLMGYVAATATEGRIEPRHLPAHVQSSHHDAMVEPIAAANQSTTEPPGFRPLADEIEALEARRMREALAYTRGNQRRAAELLGVPLRTFVTKIKRYGLHSE
ncbi:MAG: sigma-54-dependent Fis family transcriptional regulator [Polyangiaceae bacterium]|nr:sigma-54-dependent Fis family transcriptional regulator [Polyangiaceae bacterium]